MTPYFLQRVRGTRQRGQALVEFLIIFPTLLLLVLGAFQFALIYQAKLTLNYATFMAARQGALKNGKTNVIKDALGAGMTPLFATSSDLTGVMKARFIGLVEAFNPLNTQLEVLSPTTEAFNALKADSEDGASIPNDNLMYRVTDVKGGANGQSVQEANLLAIRVTYCTRLIVPIVNHVIYALYFDLVGQDVLAGTYYANASTAPTVGKRCADPNDQYKGLVSTVSGYCPTCASLMSVLPAIPTTIPGINWNVGGYRIPIVSTATVRMQSPYQP